MQQRFMKYGEPFGKMAAFGSMKFPTPYRRQPQITALPQPRGGGGGVSGQGGIMSLG